MSTTDQTRRDLIHHRVPVIGRSTADPDLHRTRRPRRVRSRTNPGQLRGAEVALVRVDPCEIHPAVRAEAEQLRRALEILQIPGRHPGHVRWAAPRQPQSAALLVSDPASTATPSTIAAIPTPARSIAARIKSAPFRNCAHTIRGWVVHRHPKTSPGGHGRPPQCVTRCDQAPPGAGNAGSAWRSSARICRSSSGRRPARSTVLGTSRFRPRNSR